MYNLEFNPNVTHLINPFIRSENFQKSTLLSDNSKNVYLKLENQQITNSFKFRGALYKLLKMKKLTNYDGVVAYSSGNHALAVATASNMLRLPSILCVPSDIPDIKRKKIESQKGEIFYYNRLKDNRELMVKELSLKNNISIIPSSNDFDIIQGAGTIGLEILKEVPDIDLILAPVGGGGLVSGVALAAHQIRPNLDVIGVEPANGNDALLSLTKGEIVTIEVPDTIADGLRHTTLSEIPFKFMKKHVTDIITVSDIEITYAIQYAFYNLNQVIEPSAAVTLAAVLFNYIPGKYKNICIILSGGNISTSLYDELLVKRKFVQY